MADATCRLCLLRADDEWLLSYVGFDPAEQGTREALLVLGNGYLATRGAFPEATADGVHYPATYVAGVYNRLISVVDGREREDESLVNLPNWLPTSFRAEGAPWLSPSSYGFVHHHVTLDLRRGLLLRDLVVVDPQQRRTQIWQERLVSMDRPHVACLRTVITPLDWSGRLHIRSAVDGRVANDNVAAHAELAKHHLGGITIGRHGGVHWLAARTRQSGIDIAVAARVTLRRDGPPATVESHAIDVDDVVGDEYDVTAAPGVPVTLDKVVAVYTSRDRAISEPVYASRSELADAPDVDLLRDAHVRAWRHLWPRLCLELGEGAGADVRRAINIHMFHVTQTLSRHAADLDVGAPARGLHGEGYRGHVFWDELFVFPLLNLRVPELSRALLRYRYRRLPQARRLATQVGAAGARFPWQSGSDGREETPEYIYNPWSQRWMPDYSRRQYHVNLAIAYNVWCYYQVTADVDFLTAYGAELLVDIARFWAALADHDPAEDRYHLRGVMGPDEFHDGYPDRPGEGLDDNAYTNIMTSWVLVKTRQVYELLGGHHADDLWQRLGLTDDELERWDHISRRLYVPFLPNGLLGQFDGYADLEELDLTARRAGYADARRLDLILRSTGDTTNRYQVSKQADVLMLFYLLSAEELTGLLHRLDYRFDPATIPDTVHYYLARTTHGSTLSSVTHAWVLARSNRHASWHLFCEALQADLSDTQGGTTREGIHLGAMASTADILQRCYTGLETHDDALWFHPRLPDQLSHLDFDLRYRGHWLRCHISRSQAVVYARPSAAPPVTVVVDGQPHLLHGGTRVAAPLQGR